MSGAPSAIEQAAQDALVRGSSSFSAAARLLPRQTRSSVTLLYAWCRYCDDVVDGQVSGSRDLAPEPDALVRLDGLRRDTLAALNGAPPSPVFAALATVATRHGLEADLFLEHLEGYAMDVDGRRYETLPDLLVYCHRVAGVVGLMMARIMGVEDKATLARAADLGLAFQLTNIARDVVDDARAGRIYAPRAWLEEAGLSGASITDAGSAPAVAELRRRLVLAAEPYYDSARIGVQALPRRAGLGIGAALNIYRRIGTKLVEAGPAAQEVRISTGKREKLAELGRAVISVARPRSLPGAVPPAPPSPYRQTSAFP